MHMSELCVNRNKETKPQHWRTRTQYSTLATRLPHRGACWAECVRSALRHVLTPIVADCGGRGTTYGHLAASGATKTKLDHMG